MDQDDLFFRYVLMIIFFHGYMSFRWKSFEALLRSPIKAYGNDKLHTPLFKWSKF